MIELLKEFYQDYLAWIESGAESDQFGRSRGLCFNLTLWCHDRGIKDEYDQIHFIMCKQFADAGLNKTLPFNAPYTKIDYRDEIYNESAYQNPQRLAWVREYAIK